MSFTADDLDGVPRKIRKRHNRTGLIKRVMQSPEVAQELLKGRTPDSIARELGISTSAVRYHMKSMAMDDLMTIEARRVMLHLSRRKLKEEKYLALSTALGNFIEKIQVLRGEPTQIVERKGTTDRLEVLLFGPRRVGQGSTDGALSQGTVGGEPRGIPALSEPNNDPSAARTGGDDRSSEEP